MDEEVRCSLERQSNRSAGGFDKTCLELAIFSACVSSKTAHRTRSKLGAKG